MMNILVVYGTSEGQTRKVGEHVAERLRRAGHDVLLADAAALPADLDLSTFAAVVLAARVHTGRHHRAVIRFIRRHRLALEAMRTLFLSVSMSAARRAPGDAERLAQCRAGLGRATRWVPGQYHEVAGARLYTRHNWLSRWILGRVDQGRYDTGKDHEFTDWPALERVIDTWAIDADSDLPSPRSPALRLVSPVRRNRTGRSQTDATA
jgi:menaquinone-dependent protoporphyrinogen oxidase